MTTKQVHHLLTLLFLAVSLMIVTVAISEEGCGFNDDDDDDDSLVPLFPHGVHHLYNPLKYKLFGIQIVIFLGNRHTRVGVERNGHVEIMKGTETPNLISFSANGTILVGEAAENQPQPLNPVFDLNRLLGRQFDHPEVQREIEVSRYDIVNKQGKPYIQVRVGGGSIAEVFSPEDLVAMFLGKIKDLAEDHFRKRIRKAVLIAPDYFDGNADYFDGSRRSALRQVAARVGFNKASLLWHRQAVIFGYNLHKKEGSANYLILHLGEASCELNIMEIENGFFITLAKRSVEHLGGKEFDRRVADHFVGLIKSKYGTDIGDDKTALDKLVKACERAKISLSSEDRVVVEIESLFDGVNFCEPLTRTKFEELNADLFEKATVLAEKALEEAGLKKANIDEYLIIGGGARIPKVRKLFKDLFGGKEAYDYAARLSPDEVLLKGGPNILSQLQVWDINLIDVLPVSVGIQTVGGVMTKVVRSNYVVPTSNKAIFTTNKDNQTTVEIKVYGGEKRLAKDGYEIGRFNLSGIHPAPRGVPRIEIVSKVGADYDLYVKANDKASNISASLERLYILSGKITSDDIDRLLEESVDEEDRMCYRLSKRGKHRYDICDPLALQLCSS